MIAGGKLLITHEGALKSNPIELIIFCKPLNLLTGVEILVCWIIVVVEMFHAQNKMPHQLSAGSDPGRVKEL